jgi:hypothetical protein
MSPSAGDPEIEARGAETKKPKTKPPKRKRPRLLGHGRIFNIPEIRPTLNGRKVFYFPAALLRETQTPSCPHVLRHPRLAKPVGRNSAAYCADRRSNQRNDERQEHQLYAPGTQ